MAGEANIAELAVAAWRLERWLDNLVAERKMAAKSSLRAIKKYLEASDIEIVDPIGWRFDPGLSIEVVNNEADEADEADLKIIETNSPIIKQKGSVIKYGRVILGTDIKEQKPNTEIIVDIKDQSLNPNVEARNPNLDIRTAVQLPDGDVRQKDTEIENKSEGKNNDLIQGELLVNAGKSQWIRRFDLRAERTGYRPVIYVKAGTTVEVELMEAKVFEEFRRGKKPLFPLNYTVPEGNNCVAPPYPDIWYAIARPPIGRNCTEFSFNMYCNWISEERLHNDDMKAEQDSDDKQDSISEQKEMKDGSNSALEEKIENSLDGKFDMNGSVLASSQEETNITEKQSQDVKDEKESENSFVIDEEEAERLRRKNKVAYNMEIARSKGLIPQLNKKKNKKKKHRK